MRDALEALLPHLTDAEEKASMTEVIGALASRIAKQPAGGR